MSARNESIQLVDLPDDILLRIFSSIADTQEESPGLLSRNACSTSRCEPISQTGKKTRRSLAGPKARTLCRLCCCSHRFNHLASADQLWQPLTLSHFPDRHWPTADQRNLELIRVRREHQQKLLQPAPSSPVLSDSALALRSQVPSQVPNKVNAEQADHGNTTAVVEGERENEEGCNKKQKRTKFYSRFEQRAHRRRFASLDPELNYTPLAWTNTMWNWKRTFFGDCRFLESKDVKSPNRIDHTIHRGQADNARQECERCWRPSRSCICSALTPHQYCNCRVRIMILQHPRCQVSIGTIRILKMSFKYCEIVIGKDFKEGRSLELDEALKNPNCTPLLLYPSLAAVDIHTLVSEPSSLPLSASDRSRYFCQDCIHAIMNSEGSHKAELESASYPYKLIIALDGSWSHAKIMYRCNPRLQQLAQIKFPSPPQSIYHELKPEPKATYTSTGEAVSQAVALLGWPYSTSMADSDKQSLTDAELLLEDLIRPLRKMIEIQDTIAQDRHKQQDPDD
ncbi:hypothetical protein EDD11_005664 [Mortierella claussenii]|nr:hypothetical protein EDD11_005664 [Mortierella claussenii]